MGIHMNGAASARQMVIDAGYPPLASNRGELLDHCNEWIDTFCRIVDVQQKRLDANESMLLAEQLEYLLAGSIDKRYKELLGKTLIPMAEGIPAGASTVKVIGFEGFGEAAYLHTYGEDIPLVDAKMKEMDTPVVGYAIAWNITLQQIRQAAMSGMPIEQKVIAAANRVMSRKEDDLLSVGDATVGIEGLLNVTGATLANLTNGDWDDPATTADDIMIDVGAAIADFAIAVDHNYTADTMLLDTDAYTRIQELPRFATGGSDKTVLDWIKDKYDMNVVKWYRCDTAGAAGIPRFAMYTNDREVIEGYAPIANEQLPPEYKSTRWQTVMHGRCGGVGSANPAAIRYADNIHT